MKKIFKSANAYYKALNKYNDLVRREKRSKKQTRKMEELDKKIIEYLGQPEKQR